MLMPDDASNARGEEGNTSRHFRDDRHTSGYGKRLTLPAISSICREIIGIESCLYSEIQTLSARMAQHVEYRHHVVLLEVRACCRLALSASSEAMSAAETFVVHCRRTFFSSDPSSGLPGQPLNDEALESFRRLSTIVREAQDALPSTEARLDELGRLLRIELNSAPGYMYLLQRTMGWGSRATLVADLPRLMNLTKARIATLAHLLHELEKQIALFHSAFKDSEWARGNYDGTKFIKAIVNVLYYFLGHSVYVGEFIEKLEDRDGVVLLHPLFTRC